jgi:hypothetical protein
MAMAAISASGRFVAFSSRASNLVDEDTNDVKDIFVHDRSLFVYTFNGFFPPADNLPAFNEVKALTQGRCAIQYLTLNVGLSSGRVFLRS